MSILRFFPTIIVLLTLAICAVGCSQKPDTASERMREYFSLDEGAESLFDKITNTITLNHDFGVLLQPVEDAVEHEFEITNNTDVAWTLQRIVNTCSCTVSDMTSTTIQPGSTEKILLVYKPIGDGAFDDFRRSLVIFEEEEAPTFILGVGARVRDPMTVRPRSLAWTRVGTNQTRRDNFEIQNYSHENWENLKISSKPQWLDIELKSVSPPVADPAMRQLWLVDTAADATKLTPGEHRGEIALLATGESGESITQTLPVVLQITSAVSAIPAQFFFGNVIPNETATRSIRIMFAPDSIPADKSEIQFEHDLGDSLKFEWLNTEGNTWEVQASLNISEVPDDPVVFLAFSDETLLRIRLPIFVMMSTRSEP